METVNTRHAQRRRRFRLGRHHARPHVGRRSFARLVAGCIFKPVEERNVRLVLGLWETRAAWDQWQRDPAFPGDCRAPGGSRTRHWRQILARSSICQWALAGLAGLTRLFVAPADARA